MDCALSEGRKTCSLNREKRILMDFMKKRGKVMKDVSIEDIVDIVKDELSVETEKEIYSHHEFKKTMGSDLSNKILKTIFKLEGPADTVELLSNFDIDNTLEQWMELAPELYNKKCYHIPYKMIDFKHTGKELYYLDIKELMDNEYCCFYCVLNTDVSSGRGKHWFCVFGDLEHEGTEEDPVIIEYFNSSGFPPRKEIVDWFNHIEAEMFKGHRLVVERKIVVQNRLQYSKTECGVWSIAYILNRLRGRPHNWFEKKNINDEDMYECRNYIFTR